MPEHRPSLLKATAPWFTGALVVSVFFFVVGFGGNPVGLVIITLAPWIFWLGPLYGAWRGRQALDRFAEEVPGTPEVSTSIWGLQTLRWPEHGIEVETRTHGPRLVGLVMRLPEGDARVAPDRAREAARAALEGEVKHPEEIQEHR